jgi:CheY-like chemotaxis protein
VGEEVPDIILLDLLLPGLSGYEVLEKLRANNDTKTTPVIVFSNLGQKEDVEKAKGLGANDFLIKANFSLDDVVAKIQEYLK